MFTYHQLVNSSFTIGASEVVLSTGELALTTGVTVSGAQVIEAIGAVVSMVGATYMFAKPNSGRIIFNDGETGIDLETGKAIEDKERAYEIFHNLKDPRKLSNWKKWLKGKGWRRSHLKK